MRFLTIIAAIWSIQASASPVLAYCLFEGKLYSPGSVLLMQDEPRECRGSETDQFQWRPLVEVPAAQRYEKSRHNDRIPYFTF